MHGLALQPPCPTLTHLARVPLRCSTKVSVPVEGGGRRLLCCLCAGDTIFLGACPAWDDAACAKCVFVYALRTRASSVSWLMDGCGVGTASPLGIANASNIFHVLRSPPPSHPLDLSQPPPHYYIHHYSCTGERDSTLPSPTSKPAAGVLS